MSIHFHDRQTAGWLLAGALDHYRGNSSAVVYALPRGGVALGAVIAKRLQVPLSLVITRKLGHPENEEFAIGAVTETGEPLLNQTWAKGLDPQWLEQAIERQRQEATRRREKYVNGQLIPATDKIAIVVDDGIATGYTVRAAINELRAQYPQSIVVAVPVAPSEIVDQLKQEADEVIVLDPGYDYLGAVGAYYDVFPQISDEEVIELLKQK